MRTIKRYQNRKLYDTLDKKYITLERIANWIRLGEEIQVVDNETGGDLTAQTLTQIIVANKRRYAQYLPISFLTGMIKLGERFSRELNKKSTQLPVMGEALDQIAQFLNELLIEVDVYTQADTSPKNPPPNKNSLVEHIIAQNQISLMLGELLESHVPTKGDIDDIMKRLDSLEVQIESITKNP
jgi:polyhydroxyalkanoate synthesis repressor PhaR